MKQKSIYVIGLFCVLAGTFAFCAERIVVRDITPTQTGVVKVKEYYCDDERLVMKEHLKPKEVIHVNSTSDEIVVQSRNRYFYNHNKQKVIEIIELPDGTVLYTTITGYDNKGEIMAERSFNNNGHNHFTRLYKNGQVVKVIEEER